MLKIIRLAILVITPIIFYGVWFVVPVLMQPDTTKWLLGIIVPLWGLELYFFQQLGDVSTVKGLSSKERQRLKLRLDYIRRRVWWVGGIATLCSLAIWIMIVMGLTADSPIYAAFTGFLFGVTISYLVLIPGWFGEIHGLIDDARNRDDLSKRREEELKNIE